jgi:endonuclease YncB( thermonuclease family)
VVAWIAFTPLQSARPADTLPAPTHPIWTLVPTHIDRDKEKHIRLAPATEAADHILLSVDRPIRFGPDTTFLVAGQPTRIFGLKLPDPQKLCVTPDNRRWACGVRAHAALSALLATRVLDCKRLSPLGASITLVTCTAGTSDIAERLVGEGWAEADPAAGVVLMSLQEAATKAHRGIWQLAPPGT